MLLRNPVDADDHVWEIAAKPFWRLDPTGSLTLR